MKLVKTGQGKQEEKRTGGKRDKERRVLFCLVEYYLKTGKPVGSNTLKEIGFPDLSSATIRNYFVNLEEQGYLKQHHTSGGRVPTEHAFRFYAQEALEQFDPNSDAHPHLAPNSATLESAEDMKAVMLFLQRIAETTAEHTACATFLTSPRFDQDFVVDLRLVAIDQSRCLAVIITSFGQIFTEVLHAPHKLSTPAVKRIEGYFHSRLADRVMEMEPLSAEEHELAVRFYQEAMARYLVSYANFSQEDMFCTGFSKLLRYPDFQEAESLVSSLSLFENKSALRSLARDSMRSGKLKCWIGEDLFTFSTNVPNCSLIAAPFNICHKAVGSIGIIGPMRMPYTRLFSILHAVAAEVTEFLEKNLYRYKITFRTPLSKEYEIDTETRKLLTGPKQQSLLEDHHK